MKRPFNIPMETRQNQKLASDPARSAWVSANAGSGKTHVLSRRVIRLLLDGTEPSKILCLTYTRAAAANMSNRVFRDLSKWATLESGKLAAEIEDLAGGPVSSQRLAGARRLFARALETPGGLKIQTIHAFCEALLHQFPLEANIAGHFEMLDDRMEAALVAEARRDLIDGASEEGGSVLAAAFADVLARAGATGLEALLSEIVRRRDHLRPFIAALANDEQPFAALFEEFGFDAADTEASLAAAAWPLPAFGATYFATFADAARAVDAASVVNSILPKAEPGFAETDPVLRLRLVAGGLLKADGTPYGPKTFKKALCDRLPGLFDNYQTAADALVAARDRIALFSMISATRSAMVVADRLIARYEMLKRARGFLDFNDLITRTAALLSRDDAGAWVQYKLDRGIDHILLDEAQDTSPDQWAVVKKLAAEFFVGQGARDNVARTIFAVGDEKQSIYSFQGAEPQAFALSGHEFRQRVTAVDARFEQVRLRHSFRSTGDVLSAVDLVFSNADAARGLSYENDPVKHDWVREAEPGYVDLWPSLGPQAVDTPDDWTEAIDHAAAPAVRLAEAIADTIHDWVSQGRLLEGKGRPVRPGDIMVLVRKRDRFMHALSRALKDARRAVPVAGADRLLLTDHIAVKDLMAIGRFALQPQDDLSLAALLRSPIFGLSEQQLYDLAAPRGEKLSLFAALREAAPEDPALLSVLQTLEDWRNKAAFQPVFEFYAGVLAGTPVRRGARSLLVARLGSDAGDIVDEFLAFAMASERTGSDGLESFIATLDSASPEIKREMDQGRDEVRIMTVHASKGLEAPIVFLVDPGSAAFSTQHAPRLIAFPPSAGLWPGNGYVWQAGSDTANAFSGALGNAIKERAEEEYRRLLYVGLTRAEDRLVVCGYHGVRGRKPDSWHALVATALEGSPHSTEVDGPVAIGPVLRYRINPADAVVAQEDPTAAPRPWEPVPPSLRMLLAPAPQLPRPLSPSGASLVISEEDEAPIAASPVLHAPDSPSRALERGSAIHRLLQVLPGLEPSRRADAARRYLALAGASWQEEDRTQDAASVMAILDHPDFAPLFAPGSRAEVAVMGKVRLGDEDRTVSGTVDRLATTDTDVLIVDYKTNRRAPYALDDVPEAYILQLALYRALLAPIYPGHAIRAALLFTAGPRLIEVPSATMDAALARLGAA